MSGNTLCDACVRQVKKPDNVASESWCNVGWDVKPVPVAPTSCSDFTPHTTEETEMSSDRVDDETFEKFEAMDEAIRTAGEELVKKLDGVLADSRFKSAEVTLAKRQVQVGLMWWVAHSEYWLGKNSDG